MSRNNGGIVVLVEGGRLSHFYLSLKYRGARTDV